MKESLKLQVFEPTEDGGKKPVTDARVVLGRRDLLGDSRYPHDDLLPTHAHLSDGFYGTFSGDPAAEPGAGEWLLVVTRDGSSPVVQRLTLKLVGQVLQASPGWAPRSGSLTQQAATVSIINAGKKAKGDAPEHTTVNVVLFPRLELLGITGHDDHGNTEYALMAEGRRNLLYKKKLLNDGAVSTLLHANKRAFVTTVKNATKDARGWLTLDTREKSPLAADAGKKRPDETVDRELEILDFYAELQRIGKSFPGTLIEAGIFSHSWTMGPIIWNTSDSTASVVDHAPGDTDGRQKDWIPSGATSQTPTGPVSDGVVMKRFPDLAKAFRKPDASLRIWGCSHMQNVIREGVVALGKLREGIPRDEFFVVGPLTTVDARGFFSGGEENTTLDHVKRLIGSFASGDRYGRALETHDLRGVLNYPGAASRFLDVPVFGAPPGMGSLYGSHGGELTFYIDDEPRPKNPAPTDPRGENFALFQWFRREFPGFFAEDPLHYVDYQKLRGAPLPDPGFRHERWAMFFDAEQRDVSLKNPSIVMRLPTGLEVHRRVPRATDPRRIFRRPTAFTFNGVGGTLYAFAGHSLELIERRGPATVVVIAPDPNLDSAAFVGPDARTLWLTAAPGTGNFAPASTPLPVERPTFFAGTQWREPRVPLPPVVDGVIEVQSTRWFW
jgi:hypothetical protein